MVVDQVLESQNRGELVPAGAPYYGQGTDPVTRRVAEQRSCVIAADVNPRAQRSLAPCRFSERLQMSRWRRPRQQSFLNKTLYPSLCLSTHSGGRRILRG